MLGAPAHNVNEEANVWAVWAEKGVTRPATEGILAEVSKSADLSVLRA